MLRGRSSVRDYIGDALKIENEQPDEALKLYRQAMKQNQEFSLLIFVVSFIAPVFAGILALRSSFISEALGSILKYIILAYIGLGVPAMLKAFRDRMKGIESLYAPKTARWFWINAIFIGPFLLVRALWLTLTALLFAFIAVIPLLAILILGNDLGIIVSGGNTLPTGLSIFGFAIFLFILLVLLADVRFEYLLPPVNGVKILYVSLRRNRTEMFEYFSMLVLSYVFASPVLNTNMFGALPLLRALIGGGVSGLFLATSLSRGDISIEWKALIQLGMSRCYIRLQKWESARLPLTPVDSEGICEYLDQQDCRKLCTCLNNQLFALLEGKREGYQPKNLEKHTEAAKEIAIPDLPDKDLWLKNIGANKQLIEAKETRASLKQFAARKHTAKLDISDLFLTALQFYYAAGIVCFVWWLIRVL